MINSLFMLGSSYNKDKKISIIFIIGWIIYMLVNYNFSLGYIFPIINISVLLTITITIKLINNKKLNTILSVISILIWSIIIDFICYFMYPNMTNGQNMISYIWQGILFNYKYIFTNIMAIYFINLIIFIKEKTKEKVFKKKIILINM